LCSDQEVEDERVFKNKEREFPVCDLATREKIKRHILKKHLPWFWSGTTACWDCGKQEIQASSRKLTFLVLKDSLVFNFLIRAQMTHLLLACTFVTMVTLTNRAKGLRR
jgi:hypothetical protein